MMLGLGCQAAGIRANAPSASPPVSSPVGVPPIRQSVSFVTIGSTEMASERYRGSGSMGYYSQGLSENIAHLMLGPSLAVEANLGAVSEVTP